MFKITIITPCCRFNYLAEIEKVLDFNYIDEWIIVYDGLKIKSNPYFFKNNNKIKEYICNDYHTGNGSVQRNYGLNKVSNEDTYIYFLDDDNTIHLNLYKFLLNETPKYLIYTFNQEKGNKGNVIKLGVIDTGMFLVHYSIAKKYIWNPYVCANDFVYINECVSNNELEWLYINDNLCYYNYFTNELLI